MERFVTVGETIGEEAGVVRAVKDNTTGRHTTTSVQDSQARKDMLEACRESRHAGNMVDKMAENLAAQVTTQLVPRILVGGPSKVVQLIDTR